MQQKNKTNPKKENAYAIAGEWTFSSFLVFRAKKL